MGQLLRQDRTATSTRKRGGARPGAGNPGTPRKKISSTVKEKILASINKWEKQSGKQFWEGLVAIAVDDESSNMDKMRAYKTIIDATVPKETHSEVDVTKRQEGPAIMLPEQMPDPVKNVA